MSLKRFLASPLGVLGAVLLVLAVMAIIFMFVVFPLIIPTEWGGATQ